METPSQKTAKITVDRFEGDWVVVEYRSNCFNLPRQLLPAGAKEGHVLEITLLIDQKTTAAKRLKAEHLLASLFQK
ncbi:MAG: DUF3006 domain-containing protein [Clostridia bacterium]|nr:DUF3006 domain-containing protein [Clostridia bacterium]